ncbi:hypothetical protein GCM10009804_26870 [Kribbella hippodromi]|uniref:Nuclease of restriction endonuclease-like (RecB) superfamily n=1 Tax=Kribbella hippodromi TaxID=434347 RepID=A0ABP4P1P2_9ACTN
MPANGRRVTGAEHENLICMNDLTPRFESAPARSSLPSWYPELLDKVSEHVAVGHRRAVTAANQEMLRSYWSIGQEILVRQDAEGWGAKVIDRLSTDLKKRFPGMTGYSPRNLKYMRAFAAAWPDPAIVQRGVAQLPWRHHIALLDKLDTAELRLWYAAAAVDRGWSRDVLVLHIEGRFHERSGKAVTNFATAMPPEESDLAQQATRDPYLFDFLGSTDGWREREVEQKLVEHVGRFLLELGQGFAFIGEQVRLELDGEEFYCDLLFYHLELRCYVVIELKAVKFNAAFLGHLAQNGSVDLEDGDAGGDVVEDLVGGVLGDVAAEEGADFPGPLLQVEAEGGDFVGVGEFLGAEGLGAAAELEAGDAAGAQVLHPLGVAARGDQVTLAVDDQQVHRRTPPLAGLATLDRQHPAAHQAHTELRQPGDDPVEDPHAALGRGDDALAVVGLLVLGHGGDLSDSRERCSLL